MGSARVDAAAGPLAPSLPAEWLPNALAFASPREIVAGLSRYVASELGCHAPAAFAGDPDCTTALRQHLAGLSPGCCTPDLLGTVWEQLLAPPERRAQGAHFTPRAVAERLVSLTLAAAGHHPELIWDPTCGGGAFLLAAARAVEAQSSRSRDEIVGGMYASDIDATALAVCDATLELWSRGTRPVTHVGDALVTLPKSWPDAVDLIVGNPPFLGQLTTDTARDGERRSALAVEYANVALGYVDESALFLELSVRRVSATGAVGLILPESFLGARDAEGARASAQSSMQLSTLWVDEGQSFAASVDVVGVVLSSSTTSARGSRVVRGLQSDFGAPVPEPPAASWAPLLADALGVPQIAIASEATLGAHAAITAGFRQHFYGIADAVQDGVPTPANPQLMTSGTIDPLRSSWGTTSVRFARRRWNTPVLDMAAIPDDAVRTWFQDRCVPKVLLASQTKVVEALVDETGVMVPSVPVISVEPHDAAFVWHLAAVLTCPAVTTWMLREAAGTGLSHDSVRIRAKTLARVPLPPDRSAWNAGAVAAQTAQNASHHGDEGQYVSSLRELANAMGSAYGVEEAIGAWWWERIRLPEGFEKTPYC